MKKKINFRLSGIAILAIFATVIGITIVYYGLFQRQIRADLAVSAKLLRDTHYFESTSINPKSINLSTDKKELRVTWVDKMEQCSMTMMCLQTKCLIIWIDLK